MSLIFSSFLLGVLTPLTAVCVIPLYPGFISYLANRLGVDDHKNKSLHLGLLVALGVIVFMALLGIIFTTILQVSLTKVISIISPIAFGVLALISVLMIFDVDFSKFLPKLQTPTARSSYKGAFLYGFFFGAIVIPCNPGVIAAFFTSAIATATGGWVMSMLNFLFFGMGIAAPLLVLSALSMTASKSIISWLVKYKSWINRIAGVIMLGVSVYYLVFVFHIFG